MILLNFEQGFLWAVHFLLLGKTASSVLLCNLAYTEKEDHNINFYDNLVSLQLHSFSTTLTLDFQT